MFKNQIWVLGGYDGNGISDVWSSSDGTNWTKVTAAAPWGPRSWPATVVFNDQMWVLGGYGPANDVWSTSDGTNWTQVTAAASWSPRYRHGAVVFNGRMWVFGGWNVFSYFNDVWSSSDGANWTQESASAPWRGREEFGAVVFNEQMWVVGGDDDSELSDVWASSDGINWMEATPTAPWGAQFGSVVFNGQIWVLGGGGGNALWPSLDGTNWTEATAAAPWSGRAGLGVVVFNDQMWMLGGYGMNDVWASVPTPPPVAGFSATPTNGFAPISVTFTDTSTGLINSRVWNFGDGGTTNLATNSVVYAYKTGGVYTVSEIVAGPGGLSTNVQPNSIVLVNCPTISLSPNGTDVTVLTDGTLETAYSQTITASGGMGTYTYVTTSGALPAGLSLSSAGILSGTPTRSGTSIFTVTATDTNGCRGSQPYSLTITCPMSSLSLPPAISMNPVTLSETITQGQDAPSQGLVVWNSAANCSTMKYSISTNASWLSVTPTNGTSAGETNTHTVSYTTTSLMPGLYNATISITSTDATNSPQTISVSLNVLSLVVSNTNDSGPGSLRQAILNGNVGGGGTILFSNVTGNITLSSGELVISNNLAISGPGATNLAISGNSASRVFDITSNATASISGLTIQNGSTNANGGAVYNLGSLVLNNCVVTASSCKGSTYVLAGGGIYNAGTLTMYSCVVSNDSAAGYYYGLGGGIYNTGVLSLVSCVISGNGCGSSGFFNGAPPPPGTGGGVYNANVLTVTNCVITGNNSGPGIRTCGSVPGSGGPGGGVYNSGTATIIASTVSQNSAGAGGSGGCNLYSGGNGGNGGGFWNGGSLIMIGCMISSNSAGAGGYGTTYAYPQFGGNGGSGGGIYNVGTLALTNCTIANNASGDGGYGDDFGNGGIACGGGNGGSGGGIWGGGALADCTIYGNSAGNGGDCSPGMFWSGPGGKGGNAGGGGGLSGGGVLINCTIYGNFTGSGGLGGYNYYHGYPIGGGTGGSGGNGGGGGGISGTWTLINCTVSSNSTGQAGAEGGSEYGMPGLPGQPGNGGGVCCSGQLLNTIVANNQAAGNGPDVSASFTSLGYNLIGNTNGSSGFGTTGDLFNVNPLLGPLADNGGPTFTCALLPGSPAIDAGTSTGAPPYDQRGVLRPQGAAFDIGAFEFVLTCPGDAVCDGIPDSWRAQYFGGSGATTNELSCATCDADGTGQNNLFKYLAGLDPTNSASVLRITSVAKQSNDVLVTWTTVGGHSYVLQSTRSTAMIAEYNTNFADASPVIVVSGVGPSTTNYLDTGAAFAPVLTPPGGHLSTTSTVPSTVDCSAVWSRGLADSLGQALPVGSQLMLGTFDISDATIQSNFYAGNLTAIMSAFTPYTNAFAVGDGTGLPASWNVSVSAAGFAGKQIYLLAVDTPTLAAANEMGIFTAPSWIFPDDGSEIPIDLEDVTDFVIGAQAGPLTISVILGGETYTFTDTARLSVLPGRILFYRVRLAQ